MKWISVDFEQWRKDNMYVQTKCLPDVYIHYGIKFTKEEVLDRYKAYLVWE